jgi:hypothetical protein
VLARGLSSACAPGRAGHGVAVLLKIYARCTDGQADTANHRITGTLGAEDSRPNRGDEGGDDADPAT